MKKLNKKGFTIVELVIVIAVIAILAAVLIPTFAAVVEKANRSAAMQNARNAVSAMEMVEDGQIPEGIFYIKSGDYYFTLKDRQLDTDSITKEKPTEDLGGRLYYGNKDFDKVEVYKAGAWNFTLRTDSSTDNTYKGENGNACSISVSANNVITITVNKTLTKTTSSDSQHKSKEIYWLGITFPKNGSCFNGSKINEDDHWLYIDVEEVLDSSYVFTFQKDSNAKAETYTIKVVLGEKVTLN